MRVWGMFAILAVVVSMASARADGLPEFAPAQFRELPRTEQIAVVRAYRDFIARIESANPNWFAANARDGWGGALAFFFPAEFAEAEEGDDLNCFNAGWPNERVGGPSGKCPRPGTGKGSALFKSVNGENKCATNSIACNPIFFGEGLCFDATQTYKDSGGNPVQGAKYAWIGCSQLSKDKKYTLDQIVSGILNNPKYLDAFHQIQKTAAKACAGDSGPTMCHALALKLGTIGKKLGVRTGSTYDCYNGVFQLWEAEQKGLPSKPSVADWKRDPDPELAMNTCGTYKDAQAKTHDWCRGLPPGYIAVGVDDAAKNQHGVIVTKLKKMGADDKDRVGPTYIPSPASGSDPDHANQLRGLLSISRDEFNAALAKGSAVSFTDEEKLNETHIVAMIKGLPTTAACKNADAKKSPACLTTLSTCGGVANDTIHTAVVDTCKLAPFNAATSCTKFVGTPASGGSGVTSGPGGK